MKEKIKKIVFSSLESVKNLVINRKNSHQLFGYDIMVDNEMNCWLIEVNSSPAMDYSTVFYKNYNKLYRFYIYFYWIEEYNY